MKPSSLIIRILFLTMMLFMSACNPQIKIKNFTSPKKNNIAYDHKIEETQTLVIPSKLQSATGIFTCYYDQTLDGSVLEVNECIDLDHLVFNTSSGEVSWNPTYRQHGKYEFIVSTDYQGVKVFEIFKVSVDKKNEAPSPIVVTGQSSYHFEQNILIELNSGNHTDVNGDTISYSYQCLSNNCNKLQSISLNSTNGELSIVTNSNSFDNYSLRFIATDGELSTLEIFNFSIVNHAPTLMLLGDVTINEGNLISFSVVGSDADSDPLKYSFSCVPTCPAGMSLDEDTGAFSWSTNYSDAGVYALSFSVTDGLLSAHEDMGITVLNTNRAPVLAALSNLTVSEDDHINFTLSATDPDGQTLTYGIALSCPSTCPSDILLDSATGEFDWTPDFESSGVYIFTFSASDGSLSDSKMMTVTVNERYRSPLLDEIGDLSVNEAGTLSHQLSGTNPEVGALTYSLTCSGSCPSGLAINGSNRLVWNPTYTDAGEYTVTVTVTNAQSLTDSETFVIEVVNVNRAPTLSAVSNYTIKDNSSTINLASLAADPDGDTLIYDCYYDTNVDGTVLGEDDCSDLDGVEFNSSTGVLVLKKATADFGLFQFKVSASDGDLSAERFFTVDYVETLPFTFSLDVAAEKRSIIVPIIVDEYWNANYSIDWGDGSPIVANQKNHTYSTAGVYVVRVYGQVDYFNLNDDGNQNFRDAFKIVHQLGNLGWKSFEWSFATSGLTSFTSGEVPATFTSLYEMFSDTRSLTTVNLSGFKTDNVIDMGRMFVDTYATSLTLDSDFNTSSVREMWGMFENSRFLTLDLSVFDTTSVTTMSAMFFNARATSINVSSFNTSNVTDFSLMFNRALIDTSLNLSHFDTRAGVDFNEMFQYVGAEHILLFGTITGNASISSWQFTGSPSQVDTFEAGSPVTIYCDRPGPGMGAMFGKGCEIPSTWSY